MSWEMYARAVPPPDADHLKAAADEFDAGRRAFKNGQFENAAVYFENADRDAPSPEALQSAIRARKDAGQAARALTLAAWGTSRYPNEKPFGDYVRGLFTELERNVYKVSIGCTPDCSLIVDSKVMPFGETAAATLYLEPGSHSVTAGWSSNRTKAADVTAVAAGSTRLTFAAPSEKVIDAATPQAPSPSGELPAQEQKGGLPSTVFWVGLGATAVLGGVTIWSGIDTVNNPGSDEVTTKCAGRGTDCPEYQEGLSHERRTNILIASTGVVGVTTAVIGLFFTKWGTDSHSDGKSDKTGAAVFPVVGFHDGASIGAVGRF
jgi:hypothetical protein